MDNNMKELNADTLEQAAGGTSFADGMTQEEKKREEVRLNLITLRRQGMTKKDAKMYIGMSYPNIMQADELTALVKEIWNSVSPVH